MKLYRVQSGIVIEQQHTFYHFTEHHWDDLVNDNQLLQRLTQLIQAATPTDNARNLLETELLPPIQNQEIWASGVTYFNSKLARQEESKDAGGGDFYQRVYDADRPELFFKSTAQRAVGHNDFVRIRKDSTWDVPEPELTLVITADAKIIGYTIGNDMSSRSIEGENPLYLPQAKSYDGSAAIGPCIYVTDTALSPETVIEMTITREGTTVFQDNIQLNQMKRKPEDLVSYLFQELSFPVGAYLMTGTGIVPTTAFTLQSGDGITISIESIGSLTNTVA